MTDRLPTPRDFNCVVHNHKICQEKLSGRNVAELIHGELSDESEVVGGSAIDQFAHSVKAYCSDTCRNCKINLYENLSIIDNKK